MPVAHGHFDASTQSAAPPVENPLQQSEPLHVVQGHVVQNGAMVKDSQLPSTQSSSRAQTFPQPPQFVGSLRVSTHDTPVSVVHTVRPPPHAPVLHEPLSQTMPAPQTVPHLPQLRGSAFDTHASPHFIVSGLHVHAPASHTSEAPQRLPQSPQLFASFLTSVHAPAQVFAGAAHPQAPATHDGVTPLQALPHVPQFAGSVVVSTQRPPHIAPDVQVHVPDTHAFPAPQALGQEPQ